MNYHEATLKKLNDYAKLLSTQYNISFKKSVHGRSKKNVIEYIHNIEKTHQPLEFQWDDSKVQYKSIEDIEELIQKCQFLKNWKQDFKLLPVPILNIFWRLKGNFELKSFTKQQLLEILKLQRDFQENWKYKSKECLFSKLSFEPSNEESCISPIHISDLIDQTNIENILSSAIKKCFQPYDKT